MSVATIDLKLETARKQSDVLFKENLSWQEQVDNMLDRMNELNGMVSKLQSVLLNLNFELERDVKGFKESTKAPEVLHQITLTVSKALRLIRKSDLYPGVKTTFGLLREENRYLKELLQDRTISIELDNDAEMQEIIANTLKAVEN